MGFLISVVGVESLPNYLFTHTNAQHTTTAAYFTPGWCFSFPNRTN